MFELSEGVWALEMIATDGEGGWIVVLILPAENGELVPVGYRRAELQEIPNTTQGVEDSLISIAGL